MRLILTTTCLSVALFFWTAAPTCLAVEVQQQSDGVNSLSSTSPDDRIDQQPQQLRHLSKKCLRDPFGECGSDCNSDCDCKTGLVCFLREEGSSGFFNFGGARGLTIPGCPAAKDLFNDYCIDPKKFPAKTLWYIGSNDKPAIVYPLKECWGDCDKDSDCEAGLTCFKGEGKTAVPGCTGTIFRGIDYCYKAPPPTPPVKPPTKAPTKSPARPPTKAPTKRPTKAPTKAPAAPQGMSMSMSMGRRR